MTYYCVKLLLLPEKKKNEIMISYDSFIFETPQEVRLLACFIKAIMTVTLIQNNNSVTEKQLHQRFPT